MEKFMLIFQGVKAAEQPSAEQMQKNMGLMNGSNLKMANLKVKIGKLGVLLCIYTPLNV